MDSTKQEFHQHGDTTAWPYDNTVDITIDELMDFIKQSEGIKEDRKYKKEMKAKRVEQPARPNWNNNKVSRKPMRRHQSR